MIAGALNFRDVGGLPAAGGVTRSGVLFRSGNLARLTAADRDALRGFGQQRIVDLRDDEEVTADPSLVEGVGAETVRVPLFLGSVASFFVDDLSLDDMYRRLLEDSASQVVEVVRSVIGAQPVLVHCTVGKDRTGVTVALMLDAVGVERDAVVADYARTEQLLPAARNERIVTFLRRTHPDATNLEALATRSPAPVMRALLAELDEGFGSPAGWLRAHGVTDAEIAALRAALVEPHAPVEADAQVRLP